MAKFVEADRDQPYLLPPDLRDWIPEDDLVHFVLEAVERVSMSAFRVNDRGTGSAQYHPRMMLALLVYCYANGVFGSRRIERATYRDLGVRYLTADLHPDHDTICAFRRNNLAAVSEAFAEVPTMARELKLLKVGTVSVDGTKVDANASRDNNVRYDRAVELREQLEGEIADLMERAKAADAAEEPDAQGLPEELSQREKLKEKLDDACAELERRAKRRAAAERREYERKAAEQASREGSRKGRPAKEPDDRPEPTKQINLTDADSGLTRKSMRHEYRQAYNAQAAVDADGSQLVLGARVSTSASDRRELVADVDSVPAAAGEPARVLADNGYATGDEVAELEARGVDVLVATGAEGRRRRRHDFRPAEQETKPKPEPKAEWLKKMHEKLGQEENKAVYRLRQQTVEPVFGIVKRAMGFRQFLLRGIDKVEGEWALVMLAYNCRRLNKLTAA